MGFIPADLGSSIDLSAATIVNTTVVGYYFLSTPGVKPYFGLGLGPYFLTTYAVDPFGSGEEFKISSTEFGFMPKVGINVGSFDLGVSYHIISDANFLALNLGFNIGKRA
ncbi:MAG: acyloxyacyl hydrolase [Bacteroidetes bacterium]|nr:acyloxyacyl hydrolase [Bacteroidota bacterium]